jgi:hypothetical protein
MAGGVVAAPKEGSEATGLLTHRTSAGRTLGLSFLALDSDSNEIAQLLAADQLELFISFGERQRFFVEYATSHENAARGSLGGHDSE